MFGKVKTIDEKGTIRWIPSKLTDDYAFMQKHGLHKMEIPQIEPIIPTIDPEEVNLEIETEPNEKETLQKQLDEKGITYKKTMGIEKLKQLLDS